MGRPMLVARVQFKSKRRRRPKAAEAADDDEGDARLLRQRPEPLRSSSLVKQETGSKAEANADASDTNVVVVVFVAPDCTSGSFAASQAATSGAKQRLRQLTRTRQGNVIGDQKGEKEVERGGRSSRVGGASKSVIILIALGTLLAGCLTRQAKALHITTFRVPAYVPITLPTVSSSAGNQQQTSISTGGQPATALARGQQQQQQQQRHPLDLAKPILLDCDYDYQPDEDARLTVRWFRNKEPEPFYQWLPELNVRHFADWIKPLINQTFVSDPHEPLKRYRSLLIKRLSMNLTGQYTCLVSSLASQDMRQASLVIYQPPRSFTFEQRVFPAPALVPPFLLPLATPLAPQPPAQVAIGPHNYYTPSQRRVEPAAIAGGSTIGHGPTQFKVFGGSQGGATLIRPPNNSNLNSINGQQPANNYSGSGSVSSGDQSPNLAASNSSSSSNVATKIVYTHDGRPIRRKSRRQADPISLSSWQLQNRPTITATAFGVSSDVVTSSHASQRDHQPVALTARVTRSELSQAGDSSQARIGAAAATATAERQYSEQFGQFAIQLHHFQCQATQVTPRPVIVLTVKRQADSIAQYLHEASSVSIRPYQVRHSDYFEQLPTLASDEQQQPLLVTLYDITVSATVALNVSLQRPAHVASGADFGRAHTSGLATQPTAAALAGQQQPGINTVLSFRRGQRMSFECHLEITGTEFEQRKRININEEEVYQFAEAEEQRRKVRLKQEQLLRNRDSSAATAQQDQADGGFGSSLGFSSSSAASLLPMGSQQASVIVMATLTLVRVLLFSRKGVLSSSK